MLQTSEEFANALVGSRLFSKEGVQEIWKSMPENDRPADAGGFADLLVLGEQLTPFQAGELLHERSTPLMLDDYVLLDRLGRGGMGEVFRARDRRLDRIVAVKVIGPWLSSEAAIKRFLREGKAAAKLSHHPNIVTTYAAGECREHHYLAMEFVDGQNLHHLAEDGLPPEQAIDYLRQAADGLAFAHAQGVIHRDIKPANLMVDNTGKLRILDMGIARVGQPLAEDGLTRTGDLIGTVDYMAPEQWSDIRNVDARCDIYSLGCTLFHLLTGRVMYEGDTSYAKARRHEQDPIPSLRDFCPAATAELERIFRLMVAKKPQDRFASMTAVQEALSAVEKHYALHHAARGSSTPWLGILNALWGTSKSFPKAKNSQPKPATNESVSAIVVIPTAQEEVSSAQRRFGTLAPDEDRLDTDAVVHSEAGTVTERRRRADRHCSSGFGFRSRVGLVLVSAALVVIVLAGLFANWRPSNESVSRLPTVDPDREPPPVQPEAPPTQPDQPPVQSAPIRTENLKPQSESASPNQTRLAWELLRSGQYAEANREATRVLSVSKALSAHICRARARQQMATDVLEPAESDVAAVMDASDLDRKSLTETELLELYHVAAELKELRGDRAARKSDFPDARKQFSEALSYYQRALAIRPHLDHLQESIHGVKAKLDSISQF